MDQQPRQPERTRIEPAIQGAMSAGAGGARRARRPVNHRRVDTAERTLTATEPRFDLGHLAGRREFARALRADPRIARRAIKICACRKPGGATGIARARIDHVHPGLTSAEDRGRAA